MHKSDCDFQFLHRLGILTASSVVVKEEGNSLFLNRVSLQWIEEILGEDFVEDENRELLNMQICRARYVCMQECGC